VCVCFGGWGLHGAVKLLHMATAWAVGLPAGCGGGVVCWAVGGTPAHETGEAGGFCGREERTRSVRGWEGRTERKGGVGGSGRAKSALFDLLLQVDLEGPDPRVPLPARTHGSLAITNHQPSLITGHH
jgi:hypothetical protein